MANRGGYKKGELRLTLTEPDRDDPDTYDDEYGFPPNAHMVSGYPVAWLPHSCDQWVIGGRPEVEQLIKDALEVLRAMDGMGHPTDDLSWVKKMYEPNV